MTYAEKLRDPRWQKKRLQILERDYWCCQSCSDGTKNLQVHHLFYAKRDPWDYPDDAYQTLCDECHRTRQGIVDSSIESLRVLLGRIPTPLLWSVVDCSIDEAKRLGAEKVEIKKPTKDPNAPIDPAKAKELFRSMREAANG